MNNMNSKQQTVERLQYIIKFYKENKPKNDKEEKQLKKAKKDLAKISQLEMEF